MQTSSDLSHANGFSLLEVLISVVVLSFGLLALGTVQGSLFKRSAEVKAQSVGLALATEKLEYFRGFTDIVDYQAITDGSDNVVQGGVSYTRTWTVLRYAYPEVGGDFTTVADTGALGSTYVANNEFKRIRVDVDWTDAENVGQRVSLEAAIAALDPSDSAKLAKVTGGVGPRGPRVNIYNPEDQQEGVIPIAVGDGSDTAATNPKPLVNAGNVVETRFDVLTYRDNGDGTAVAQSRIATSVVGCNCSYATAPSVGAKRPTYWDGHRYVEPEDATAVLGASFTPLAGEAPGSQQSALCTICCRDHHDPASLPADAVRFDPRNPSHSMGHFLVEQDASGSKVLTGPLTSGTYTESCRVIRVGGLFRVAADIYNDYQNFLVTNDKPVDDDGNVLTPYLPTDDDQTNYQRFVRGYLEKRVVTQTNESSWNDVLPVDHPGWVSDLETGYDIYAVQPDAIDFQRNAPPKWLHLRGLYIDYLEDKAKQAIADAKANCTSAGGGAPTSSDLETCVLKVLPFTSINLTELGRYTPTSGTQIVVANNNFAQTLSDNVPVRGKVTLGSDPTTGLATDAVATMRRSNSGLATMPIGIDPEDEGGATPATWVAKQPYIPVGDSSGEGGGSFDVTLSGYEYDEANLGNQYITALPSATCNADVNGNPWVCTSATLGVDYKLTLGRYNYAVPENVGKRTLTCTDSLGASFSHSFNNAKVPINVCKNFDVVAGASYSAETLNDGKIGETTVVSFSNVTEGAHLTIQFNAQDDSLSYTCTLPSGGDPTKDKDYVIGAADCP